MLVLCDCGCMRVDLCACVHACFRLWAWIARLYDVRFTLSTPHALTHFTAMLLCRGSVMLYIMKWGNTDLFLASKSTCCNGALVSAFPLITWHMLRLWASKIQALHLLGDVMELLKRMNNHHQNTRTFIGDWTGSSTQLNTERERQREWLERVRTKQRRKREGKGVWSEFGQ